MAAQFWQTGFLIILFSFEISNRLCFSQTNVQRENPLLSDPHYFGNPTRTFIRDRFNMSSKADTTTLTGLPGVNTNNLTNPPHISQRSLETTTQENGLFAERAAEPENQYPGGVNFASIFFGLILVILVAGLVSSPLPSASPLSY
jgi:hypothetical protein